MKWILLIGLFSNSEAVYDRLEYSTEQECRVAEIVALESVVEENTAIITSCKPL